jgi:hypothetical protein
MGKTQRRTAAEGFRTAAALQGSESHRDLVFTTAYGWKKQVVGSQ